MKRQRRKRTTEVGGVPILETIEMQENPHMLMEIANGMGLAGDFIGRSWMHPVFMTEYAIGGLPRSPQDPVHMMLHRCLIIL